MPARPDRGPKCAFYISRPTHPIIIIIHPPTLPTQPQANAEALARASGVSAQQFPQQAQAQATANAASQVGGAMVEWLMHQMLPPTRAPEVADQVVVYQLHCCGCSAWSAAKQVDRASYDTHKLPCQQ